MALAAGLSMVANVSATSVPQTPEWRCQYGRASAAGKYAQCELKALAGFKLSGAFLSSEPYELASAACVTKYAAAWAKLQAKAAGNGDTCDNARFVDNGDGTVTDRLTGLQWEKKEKLDGTPNVLDPHDADNTYSWSASGTAADGTVFTGFLSSLNGTCFASQCDWRLPTRAELLTITEPAFPLCTAGPCIDPVFGPTPLFGPYWSATTYDGYTVNAWGVGFFDGSVLDDAKTYDDDHVRAVRGGL